MKKVILFIGMFFIVVSCNHDSDVVPVTDVNKNSTVSPENVANDSDFQELRMLQSNFEKKLLLQLHGLTSEEKVYKLQLLQNEAEKIKTSKELGDFVVKLGFGSSEEYSKINDQFVEHFSKLNKKFMLNNMNSRDRKEVLANAYGVVESQKDRLRNSEMILQDVIGSGPNSCYQTWEICNKDADAESVAECGLCLIAFEAPPVLGVCLFAAGVKALMAKIKCDRSYSDCCVIIRPSSFPSLTPIKRTDLGPLIPN